MVNLPLAPPPPAAVSVSVLVCTHNRAQDLAETLARCRLATEALGERVELIVCPNGCVDDTRVVLDNLAPQTSGARVRVFELAAAGKSAAFIKGVLEAEGEFIVVLDDDNTLEIGWLERAIGFLAEHPEVGVVGCHSRLPEATARGLDPRVEAHLRHYAVGRQEPAATYAGGSLLARVWGAGMVFRREPLRGWFARGGGFVLPGRVGPNMIAGEDTELCLIYARFGLATVALDYLGIVHRIAPSRLDFKVLRRLWRSEGAAFQFYRNYETPMALLRPANSERDADWRVVWPRVWVEAGSVALHVLGAASIYLVRRDLRWLRTFEVWYGRWFGLSALVSDRARIAAHLKLFASYAPA
jgi:glycosyltransferase involved in cell wall biosynthesis